MTDNKSQKSPTINVSTNNIKNIMIDGITNAPVKPATPANPSKKRIIASAKKTKESRISAPKCGPRKCLRNSAIYIPHS